MVCGLLNFFRSYNGVRVWWVSTYIWLMNDWWWIDWYTYILWFLIISCYNTISFFKECPELADPPNGRVDLDGRHFQVTRARLTWMKDRQGNNGLTWMTGFSRLQWQGWSGRQTFSVNNGKVDLEDKELPGNNDIVDLADNGYFQVKTSMLTWSTGT